ncbi:hypothetical protein PHMEG_00022054 [Phytophthora megakarya]|uniref:Uncharacterized protein n=1 Tax=Phytophthora megakarya TaxID=4795 RepID=A0A225VLP2_9STRA|nr:hypothetical protein PHMEG_00022054 [Phytophthora megakarya]
MDKGKQQQLNPSGNDHGNGNDKLAGSTLEDYFAMHKCSGHISQHLLNVPTENDVMAAKNDNYEDESEIVSSKGDLAGMSLSDYLHVKDDDSVGEQEKLSSTGSLRVLPSQNAASAKNYTPVCNVTGMPLDHYLGASVHADNSEEKKHAPSDKKSSPKIKRKGVKCKQKSSSTNTPDSHLTPYQRRQKRKEKIKIKQQRNTGNGLSVSKTVLMAEAGSSQSTILPVRDREKRKSSLASSNAPIHAHHPSHHGSNSSASHIQPPLPKLAVSPSIRSLSHKDIDTQDNNEKLPPL